MDAFINSLSLSQVTNLQEIFQNTSKNVSIEYSTFLNNDNYKKKLLSSLIPKLRKEQKLSPEIFDIAESLEDKEFRNEFFRLPLDVKKGCEDDNGIFPRKDKNYIKNEKENENKNHDTLVDTMKNYYTDYNPENVSDMMKSIYYNRFINKKYIILTMTTCKRLDLFKSTVNSFLECCIDKELISEWIVVDDNSSEEDRKEMVRLYPFIHYIFKGKDMKGHPISMNVIRNVCLGFKFNFHLEDDWSFIAKKNFIGETIKVLESDKTYGQCLLNKNYYEAGQCLDIAGGIDKKLKVTSDNTEEKKMNKKNAKEEKIISGVVHFSIHDQSYKPSPYEKSCAYWPHYSLRPGMNYVSRVYSVGLFNQKVNHFEREYADRYVKTGMKTTFLNGIYCLHTGRRTFEMFDDNKLNAYKLNNEAQFFGKETINNTTTNTNQSQNNTINNNEKSSSSMSASTTQISLPINLPKMITLPPVPEEEIVSLSGTPSGMPSGIDKKENTITSNITEKKETIFSMRTYVINLKRRPERLHEFKKKNDSEISELKYSVFDAIDGYNIELTPKLRKLFEIGDYNYRKGIIGCSLSHIKLWYTLLGENDPDMIYCILEDDAHVVPGFVSKLMNILKALPKDFGVLYLGHHKRKIEDQKIDMISASLHAIPSNSRYMDNDLTLELWPTNKSIENSLGGTFGYIISRSGAAGILNHIIERGMYNAIDWVAFKAPVKNFYCNPSIVLSPVVASLDLASLVVENTPNNSLNISSSTNITKDNSFSLSDIQNDLRCFPYSSPEESLAFEMKYWLTNQNLYLTSYSTSSICTERTKSIMNTIIVLNSYSNNHIKGSNNTCDNKECSCNGNAGVNILSKDISSRYNFTFVDYGDSYVYNGVGVSFIPRKVLEEEFKVYINGLKECLLCTISFIDIRQVDKNIISSFVDKVLLFPVKIYSIKNEFLICIPNGKLNDKAKRDVVLKGYLNSENPI
jgi:GR25 family glycosyltransferase involved in LPS biosynthesis